MNNFDWQTEEDAGWDEDLAVQAPKKRGPRRSLPRFTWIFALILLVGMAVVVYWRWQEQLENVTRTVEDEILSTHNLLGQAVVDGDLDLVGPLLSGRDMAWTTAQQTVVREGLFFDRTAMGLAWVDANNRYPPLQIGDDALVGLELAPELDAAELTFRLPYIDAVTGDEVALVQTAVYRRGENRWLYAPPLDDFWGEWNTITGSHTILVFPARDVALATKLQIDLDFLLADLCRQIAEVESRTETAPFCGESALLMIRMETDPAALAAQAERSARYEQYPRLEFPTPTLLGLPVDDAGYDALFRAYARPIVAAAVAEYVGYECCAHALFFDAAMHAFLAELGLTAVVDIPPPKRC